MCGKPGLLSQSLAALQSCYLIGNKIWIQHMTFCFLDKVNEVDPKVFMKNKLVSGTLGTTEEQLEASTLRIPIPAL